MDLVDSSYEVHNNDHSNLVNMNKQILGKKKQLNKYI